MQIKGKSNKKRGKDQIWSHFLGEQIVKRKGEKKRRGRGRRRRSQERYGILYGNAMILYGNYLGKDLYGFLWMIGCSNSRVYLGIHPNPRFVGSWVEKP